MATIEYRGVYLVILCCALMHMSVIGSDIVIYHCFNEDGTLVVLVSQAVAYLLYPLLGWLADVYFTRYGMGCMVQQNSILVLINNKVCYKDI